MIVFRNIIIEGFKRLAKYQEIVIQEGLTFIEAPNGSGKTTMIEALMWSLYGGDALNDITKDEIPSRERIRDHDFRGTFVSVDFKIGEGYEYRYYRVVRTIDYKGEVAAGITGGSGLYLFIYGSLQPQRAIKDVQSMIDSILQIDLNTFTLTTYINQSGKSFLNSSTVSKTSLIDNFFNFNWVDGALSKAKATQETLIARIINLRKNVSAIGVDISIKKLEQTNQEQAKATHYEREKEKIATYNAAVLDLEQRLIEKQVMYDSVCNELESLPKEITVQTNHKEIYQKALSEYEKAVREIEYNEVAKIAEKQQREYRSKPIELNCSVCGAALSEEKQDELKTSQKIAIDNHNVKLEKLIDIGINLLEDRNIKQINIESLKVKADEEQSQLMLLAEYRGRNRALKERVASIEGELKHITELLINKKEKVPEIKLFREVDYTEAINMLEALKVKEQELIEEKEQEKAIVDFWVSKGFSAKGLKAYLTNAVLKNLNQALSRYANYLGWDIELGVNLEAASKSILVTIHNEHFELVRFGSLSGGEKRRIELAVTLAFNDMMPVQTNLMFLDEPFHNLDDDGFLKMMDLLRETAKEKSIYITTPIPMVDSFGANKLSIEKTEVGSRFFK